MGRPPSASAAGATCHRPPREPCRRRLREMSGEGREARREPRWGALSYRARLHAGRELDYEGYGSRSLIGIGLAPHMVVAEHISVVRHEAYQRIVAHILGFQLSHNPPHLLVDKGHGGIVVAARSACIVSPKLLRALDGLASGSVSRGTSPHHWPTHRSRNVYAVVHIYQSLRRIVGGYVVGQTTPSGKTDCRSCSREWPQRPCRQSTPWGEDAWAVHKARRRGRSIRGRCCRG